MFFRITLFLTFLLFGFSIAQEQLSLEDCIQIALENNSNLIQTQYSNEAAEYDVTGSYSGILPSLDVSGSVSRTYLSDRETFGQIPIIDPNTGQVVSFRYGKTTDPADDFEDYSLSARVNQNLFDGLAWYNEIRKAKIDKDISDFDLQDQINATILTIQRDYYDLIKQKKLYEVYKIAVERSQAQLERTEKMYSLGSKAKLDVFQAKVNLGNDKINLLSQENIVDDARRKLNLSMGNEPNEELNISNLDFQYSQVSSLTELQQTAEENQPLLKRDEKQVVSDNLNVQLSKSRFYPQFSAYFSYSRYSGFEIEKLYSDFDLNYRYSYGLSLNWNLFSGLTDYVNVQKSKIAEKSAKEQFENYKRQLQSRITGLLENYKSFEEIIEINKENLEAAKEELRLAEERYQIGAGTALEVREAQVKLTRAEETLIAAQYNALSSLADLDYELGITAKKFNQ